MSTLASLLVTLGLDASGFHKGIGGVEKSASGLMKLGAGMTAGITTPILGIGVAVLAVGGQFDEAMDTIRTTTGATGSELTGLGEDVKAVFSKIPTDMATAAQAVSELNARTGQSGKGLQDLAAAEIELARITGGDLGSQIQNSTRMFGDWGIAVTDQVPALDMLLRAHQATGIGVDTLAAKLVQFGAPLRQMGFDFETSAALIGKFEKEGVNTELVLGSMRIALGKMAKAGIEPKEGLKQLVDQIKSAGSTAEANKLAFAAFGARAGPDMAAAIREGRFSLDDLYKTIADGQETVMGAAGDTNDYAEKLKILKNKATAAAIPLGVTLFDAINKSMPMIEKVIGFVSRLITGFSNLPSGVQTGIMAFVALVAALGPVIGTVGAIISVVSAIGPALAAVGAVIGTALGPVLLILAAIVAAVLLFKAAWDSNFLGIRDTLQAVFAEIKNIVGPVVAWLNGEMSFSDMAAKVGAALSRIGAIFAEQWERIKAKVGEILAAIGQVIVDKLAEFLAPLVGGMDNAKRLIGDAWENIKTAVAAAWEAIKGVVGGAIEFVRGLLAGLVAFLAGEPSTAWTALGAAVGKAWDSIKAGVGTAVETLRSGLANKWGEMLANAGTKWDAVKTRITTVVGGIKDVVVGTLGEIVSAAAGLFGKILDAVSGGGGGGASGSGAGLGTLLNVVQLKATITQVVTELQSLRKTTAGIWALMQADIVLWWTLMQTTLFTMTQMMQQTTVLNYRGILGGFRAMGQLMMLEIATTWGIITATVITAAETMRAGAVAATTAMAAEILGILNGLASGAYSAGQAIGNGVADGIRDSIGAAVAAAQELAAAVAAVLPHSDADEGPLSHLTDSGRALPETLAKGMLAGAGALERAMSGMLAAPTFQGTGDGGQGTGDRGQGTGDRSQVINVTINNPRGQAAESDILRQLRNLAYVGVLTPA
jgi:TP901 family phage tail tape measure protein